MVFLDSADISGEVKEMVGERPAENAAGSKTKKGQKSKKIQTKYYGYHFGERRRPVHNTFNGITRAGHTEANLEKNAGSTNQKTGF